MCDVCSTPFSQFTPHAELGARSEDRSCYQNGKISYERLSRTALFQSGLARVQEGLNKGFRIVLMCAEREPLECHRSVLVARGLAALGIEIQHIHADGSLESHTDALIRLAALVRVPEADLFRSAEELRIAYEGEPEELALTAG